MGGAEAVGPSRSSGEVRLGHGVSVGLVVDAEVGVGDVVCVPGWAAGGRGAAPAGTVGDAAGAGGPGTDGRAVGDWVPGAEEESAPLGGVADVVSVPPMSGVGVGTGSVEEESPLVAPGGGTGAADVLGVTGAAGGVGAVGEGRTEDVPAGSGVAGPEGAGHAPGGAVTTDVGIGGGGVAPLVPGTDGMSRPGAEPGEHGGVPGGRASATPGGSAVVLGGGTSTPVLGIPPVAAGAGDAGVGASTGAAVVGGVSGATGPAGDGEEGGAGVFPPATGGDVGGPGVTGVTETTTGRDRSTGTSTRTLSCAGAPVDGVGLCCAEVVSAVVDGTSTPAGGGGGGGGAGAFVAVA